MKSVSFAVFFLIACFLHAIQWPVDEPDLLYGFGTPLAEGVANGIGLKGSDAEIKPFDEGELIFMAREGYGPGVEGGGIAVLQHEGGFRSCYGQINPEKDLESRSYLKEDDLLGTAPEGLSFSIRDSKLNQWVNPFFMFSVDEDRFDPAVESVILEKDGQISVLSPSSAFPAGSYRLLVKISDRMDEEGAVLLPYSLKIRYLGQVLFSLSLDSLVNREGKSYFEGGGLLDSESLFTSDGFIDAGNIVINQGKGLLEVEITDYRGNRTTMTYSLNRG